MEVDVTVLYGSQTGNAARIATDLTRRLRRMGLRPVLRCMSEMPSNRLAETRYLLSVVSTHGQGDPPDKAVRFYEVLHGENAPRLVGVRFAVLALGDIGYAQFCAAGRRLDQRLAELGAERLVPRADCDVDYTESAEAWMHGALDVLAREVGGGPRRRPSDYRPTATLPGMPAGYSRARPFSAELVDRFKLNGRGSGKATYHLEFSIEGAGLKYEPGDALGVYPENDPRLVEELLRAMRWDDDAPVPAGGAKHSLWDALLRYYEITRLTRPLLEQASRFGMPYLAELLHPERKAELDAYMDGRDLLDLVRDFSLWHVPPAEFVAILRRMPPRLYSIAGSYRANAGRVAVTMATVRYRTHGRDRCGVCSAYCTDRISVGECVPVFVNDNPNFRLPADPASDLVMIGPGTGVAPFRAFLQEREATGATGKSWLFFGDHRFRTDFLYQTDWHRWLQQGRLTRMDVAFSRDTEPKTYVQHRMMEHRRVLLSWLNHGAYVYVCGNQKRMAPSVHSALETILAGSAGTAPCEACNRLKELMTQGRYQRDVY